MSSDIDFMENGRIYAGIRDVGRFEIIDEEFEKLRKVVLGDML